MSNDTTPTPLSQQAASPVSEGYVTRGELDSAVRIVTDRQARYEQICEDDRRSLRTDLTRLADAVVETRAEVKSLRAEQATQTLILTRLDRIMSGALADPKVKLLLQLLLVALTGWLASKGLKAPQ